MKLQWLLVALLVLTGAATAKEKKQFQKGLLLQMESVQCGYAEKSGNGITGALLGTDSSQKKTREMLCQEYVLQSERVIYRIRPKDEKNPVLLPVGEQVQFRIDKDKMKLRSPDEDGKERDYLVISMTPRAETLAAKNCEACPEKSKKD